MDGENLIQSQYEKSKLLSLLSLGLIIWVVVCGAVVVFTNIIFKWVGIDVYTLTLIPCLMALLYGFAAMIYGSLAKNSANEKLEQFLLKRSTRQSAFDASEDLRYTAKRRLENYSKYSPYVFAVFGLIIIGLSLFFFWSSWTSRVELPAVKEPLQKAFLGAVMMIATIIPGVFCIGQSRDPEFRWLRPAGAWLCVAFLTTAFTVLDGMMVHFDVAMGDQFFKTAMFWLFIVLGVELIANFVTEFYRPRTRAIARPVFESRLLALVTEPGGIMRNIADTLDYQFGFKVSKTWIYTFLETALARLIVLWLVVLWLTTCVDEVGPDEVGVRETFGKIADEKAEPLGPGLHGKLPWPFGRIVRFPIYRIQELVIGPQMKKRTAANRKSEEVILWTVNHYAKEARYVVAAQKTADVNSKEVPVSFLSASFPIQYRIKKDKIINYYYKYKDAKNILKDVADKVVTRYLASVDMNHILSDSRHKTSLELQKRIQEDLDKLDLGIEIVLVNFHDSHPPVEKVAPEYQEVIGALEKKEADILEADAYGIKREQEALAETKRISLSAEAEKNTAIEIAKAERERFQKQLEAYRQMPTMFKLRTYLKFLEDDTVDIRKFILSEKYKTEVYQINLEEKMRFDLSDADMSSLDE